MTRSAGIALALVAALTGGIGAATAGPVFDRIVGSGEVRFGARTDAPPFASLDGETLSGFSVDLCAAVGRALAEADGVEGLSGRFVEVNAANRFDKLEAGEIDVLCGATTATLSRRERVSFTIPTFSTGVGAAVRADAPDLLREVLVETSPAAASDAAVRAALEGRTLGVRSGTTAEDWLTASGLPGIEGVTVRGLDDHFAAMAALEAGEIDAYFADRALLVGLTRNRGEAPPLVGRKSFTSEPYALAIPRGDEELRLLLDTALSRLYRSGAILRLFERHFGPPSPEVVFFYRSVALPE